MLRRAVMSEPRFSIEEVTDPEQRARRNDEWLQRC
jgi:hypothetical protein